MSTALALNQTDAAKALGVSVNTFKLSVRPYINYARVGGSIRYLVSDLEAWLDGQVQRP